MQYIQYLHVLRVIVSNYCLRNVCLQGHYSEPVMKWEEWHKVASDLTRAPEWGQWGGTGGSEVGSWANATVGEGLEFNRAALFNRLIHSFTECKPNVVTAAGLTGKSAVNQES